MKPKYIVGSIVVLAVIGAVLFFGVPQSEPEEPTPSEAVIASFDECVEAGNLIMESYPRRCRTEDGKTFVEDIGNGLEKTDLIRVGIPRPNQLIQSPLTIEGEARGFWFFEADFPIQLLDGDGNEIAIGIAETQEEWMTEEFVPFQASIEFEGPTTKKGTLVLKKDNPSGLPENDDELIIPAFFE